MIKPEDIVFTLEYLGKEPWRKSEYEAECEVKIRCHSAVDAESLNWPGFKEQLEKRLKRQILEFVYGDAISLIRKAIREMDRSVDNTEPINTLLDLIERLAGNK